MLGIAQLAGFVRNRNPTGDSGGDLVAPLLRKQGVQDPGGGCLVYISSFCDLLQRRAAVPAGGIVGAAARVHLAADHGVGKAAVFGKLVDRVQADPVDQIVAAVVAALAEHEIHQVAVVRTGGPVFHALLVAPGNEELDEAGRLNFFRIQADQDFRIRLVEVNRPGSLLPCQLRLNVGFQRCHGRVTEEGAEEKGHGLRAGAGLVRLEFLLPAAHDDAVLRAPADCGMVIALRLHVPEAGPVGRRGFSACPPEEGDHFRAGNDPVRRKTGLARAVGDPLLHGPADCPGVPRVCRNVPERAGRLWRRTALGAPEEGDHLRTGAGPVRAERRGGGPLYDLFASCPQNRRSIPGVFRNVRKRRVGSSDRHGHNRDEREQYEYRAKEPFHVGISSHPRNDSALRAGF